MHISDTMFGNYEVINDRIMNALKEVGYDEQQIDERTNCML